MSSPHHFSLRWNDYNRHISLAFDSLRSQEDLVDVTLSCEGRKIRAHKILLSACSSYFRDIFKENPCQHPVIIFKNVKFDDLTAIIEFMYQGEVSVIQEALPSFLHTAELLSVQGLTESKEYVPQTETIQQMPKVTKMYPVALATSSAVIDLPKPTIKKQKLTEVTQRDATQIHLSHDENGHEVYMESVITPQQHYQQQQSNDEQMDLKPFRSMHSASTNIHIQTDDDNFSQDDERDDNIQHESYEVVHDPSDDRGDEMDNDNDMDGDIKIQTHEIQTVEMSRIFTSKPGETSKMQDGELKFRCSICWKGFKHPNSLTLHKDMHNGKTKCPVCSRAFSRSYDMKTHMTKIHKILLSVETKFNLSEQPPKEERME